MALTKTQLKEILSAAGVSAELAETAIGKIMDGHVASINALREDKEGLAAELAKYKADVEKLESVQKELDGLKAKGDPDWQKKYEAEHSAFEQFKTETENEKLKSQKTSLYKSLLKDCKIGNKQIDAILKITDLSGLAIKDGKFEDEDKLKSSIAKEWSAFVMKDETQGAKVDNPPANGGAGKAEGRAAKIAAEYHKNLYGERKDG